MTRGARRTAAAFVVAGAALAAACSSGSSVTRPRGTTTRSATTTTTSNPGASTTLATTTTVGPAPTTTPTAAARPVPAKVGFVVASSGGGSGEIEVNWEAVTAAIGYRVYRAASPSGPYVVGADWDVVAGTKTLAQGVTNLWSPPADYPPFTSVPGVATPRHFQYVEVNGLDRRYFWVAGYNAAGEGPRSVVVCGTPVGGHHC